MVKHCEMKRNSTAQVSFFSNEDVRNASQACFHPQLKLFHSELLAQLEQKLELDIKYLTVSVETAQEQPKPQIQISCSYTEPAGKGTWKDLHPPTWEGAVCKAWTRESGPTGFNVVAI